MISLKLEFVHKNIIIAQLTLEYPIIKGKVQEEQASGAIPIREKGVRNVASDDAQTTSQRASVDTPIPIAGPLTATIIGFGKSIKQSTKFLEKI